MPEQGRTSISFVAGGQSQWLLQWEVERWRLPHRFAVVQDTYRADMVDMYRDKSVWFRLFEFAQQYSEGAALTIVDRQSRASGHITEADEKSCEAYLVSQEGMSDEDWDAPERIVVRENGAPVLVIAAEYWANIGGPDLYHDSMTYSIYSKEDVSARVMRFLADADAAGGWLLSEVVHA